MLLLSGQVALDAERHCPTNFGEQARLAWRNVEAQLASAGRGLEDIVKVTTFLADRCYAEENKAIRNEIMAGRTFANTLVIAALYDPKWLIEVEVVAAW
jgi:enamine deaminase RidA (YjgF/YER057c/UK114 family)